MKLLLLISTLLCLAPASCLVVAQTDEPENPEIILSADNPEDESTHTNAEIIPVPGGGTVFALRPGDTGELSYRFALTAVNLADFLGTLSQTLYDENDTAAIIRHGERLTLWDNSARQRYIDIDANNLTLTAVLDLASLASGCNIYIDGEEIVVDRCGN